LATSVIVFRVFLAWRNQVPDEGRVIAFRPISRDDAEHEKAARAHWIDRVAPA
jgi:hypothetical protein